MTPLESSVSEARICGIYVEPSITILEVLFDNHDMFIVQATGNLLRKERKDQIQDLVKNSELAIRLDLNPRT
jgi:hypothetical protein